MLTRKRLYKGKYLFVARIIEKDFMIIANRQILGVYHNNTESSFNLMN